MTKRIANTIIKVSALILVLTMLLLIVVLYNYFEKIQLSQQSNILSLAEKGYEDLGVEYFEDLDAGHFRITLIDEDGTVLFDNQSNPKEMENHKDREEVKEAIESGFGESERFSKTLSEKTSYTSKKIKDGKVLRVSTTKKTIASLLGGIINPILGSIVIIILISFVFSRRLSKNIVDPINKLDLERPLENKLYDELSPLLVKIDKQNKKINNQIADIESKNKEISYIMKNVSDGIIVLNKDGKVISANKKAQLLFDCNDDEYYLDFCRDLDYKQIVEKALGGQKSSCKLEIEESVYKISSSCIKTEDESFYVFLFISDITEEEQAQKMRREFTANVSHELKTPLSSIMGTAEMMESGLVELEDIQYFAGKIYTESDRLLTLIQDIIELSELDEGQLKISFEDVNLKDVCNEVIIKLADKASEKSIDFETDCKDVVVKGYPSILYEMIYNLCDNAICYNNEKGFIKVSCGTKDAKAFISIEDDGIGIDIKDQNRIFERFYRVDKSHSKETGGTGLGLSIVKHGANLHNAKLEVESKLNEGSIFRLKFNQ
ncbi:MAG: HAMP domain-containing histidine kinase [Clostridia bacterium]|nr:HAMP domain-containing histidine kinase [Clostridia bacterium]